MKLDFLSYLYVFLQSNLIEVLVYYIFYRLQISFSKNLGLVTLSNSITHPIVFFGFMQSGRSYLESILWAETFAVASETILHSYFGQLDLKKTSVAALISNLVSWQLAPMITYIFFFT